MWPNNGVLFNDVLKTKLLNNPSASCSFINLDSFCYILHIW